MQIEYRVKSTNRFIVTRFEADDGNSAGGVSQIGEYSSPEVAYEVAYALAVAEHTRLGWPLDDNRIRYPVVPSEWDLSGPLQPR